MPATAIVWIATRYAIWTGYNRGAAYRAVGVDGATHFGQGCMTFMDSIEGWLATEASKGHGTGDQLAHAEVDEKIALNNSSVSDPTCRDI